MFLGMNLNSNNMEEIKVGDIMVGNWFIRYDDKPFQWKIDDFSDLLFVYVDEIIKSPIPLTEDILIKAGAKKVNHINGYSFWTFSDSKINKAHVDIYDGKTCYYGYSVNHCKHLHTLQNLFKLLTGNYLKIYIYMKIGEYIQKARKEIEYTQYDIAKHLSLSRPSIGNIEN